MFPHGKEITRSTPVFNVNRRRLRGVSITGVLVAAL